MFVFVIGGVLIQVHCFYSLFVACNGRCMLFSFFRLMFVDFCLSLLFVFVFVCCALVVCC